MGMRESLLKGWRRFGLAMVALTAVLALAGGALAAKPMVAGGSNASMVLTANGGIEVWGNNDYGKLGTGDTTAHSTPYGVSSFSDVIQAVPGNYHSAVLLADGTVKTMGINSYGQLGVGDTSTHTSPMAISNFSNVKQLAVGAYHTLALKADGTVWAWGNNSYGQLGDNSNYNRSSPVRVYGLEGVKMIAAGFYCSAALTSAGEVWTWGDNSYGQLADNNPLNPKSLVPLKVSGLSAVKQISIGYHHVLALLADGTVKSWGYNNAGQLGNGDTYNQWSPVSVTGSLVGVKQIAAGGFHSLALLDSGSVKAWGHNVYKQLGDGTQTSSSTPVAATSTTGVIQVAGGNYHSLFLLANGDVLTFGKNNESQLGDGGTTNSSTALYAMNVNPAEGIDLVQVSYPGDFVVALASDGTVWAWGDNTFYVLGTDDPDPIYAPLQVSGISNVIQLAVGFDYVIALKADGTVWAWGNNSNGYLGNGTLNPTQTKTPAQIPNFTGVIQLGGLSSGTLALKSNGTVYGWGDNGLGQLGDASMTDRLSPVQVSTSTSIPAVISLGSGGYGYTTTAITHDGHLWLWGGNRSGQLGDYTTTNSSVPLEQGDLEGVIGSTSTIDNAFALLSDGKVWTWGDNGSGYLGDGTNNDSLYPLEASVLEYVKALTDSNGPASAVTAGGKTYEWGEGVSTPTENQNLGNAVQTSKTATVKSDGSLWIYGNNNYGQLGGGTADGDSHPTPSAVTFPP